MGREEGVTLFMTLLAAFQTLLYRWTGQTDVIVGTDVANRTHLETEALIGFFINLLALRTDLSGAPSFRTLLHQVRNMILNAHTHQDIPFEMLVEHLRLERRMNQTPLIQLLFVWQNQPTSSQAISGLTIEAVTGEAQAAKFDLALFMREEMTGIHGAIIYQTDLFEEKTIASLTGRFETLLRSIVAQPANSIDALDISTEADKKQQEHADRETHISLQKEMRASKGKEVDLEGFTFQPKKR